MYYAYPEFEQFCSMEMLLERFEITAAYNAFQKLERMFVELIFDQKQWIESRVFRGGDRAACMESIRRILEA